MIRANVVGYTRGFHDISRVVSILCNTRIQTHYALHMGFSPRDPRHDRIIPPYLDHSNSSYSTRFQSTNISHPCYLILVPILASSQHFTYMSFMARDGIVLATIRDWVILHLNIWIGLSYIKT